MGLKYANASYIYFIRYSKYTFVWCDFSDEQRNRLLVKCIMYYTYTQLHVCLSFIKIWEVDGV